MPRFISKSTGARSAKPNGLALIKKKPLVTHIGKRKSNHNNVLNKTENKCNCK